MLCSQRGVIFSEISHEDFPGIWMAVIQDDFLKLCRASTIATVEDAERKVNESVILFGSLVVMV